MSDRLRDHCTYSAIACAFTGVRSRTHSTNGCSGATTIYVAPKSVSGRVVKTVRSPNPSTANRTSAPSLRPIHAACIMRVDSGHSTKSRSSRSLCAYAVIRNIHCRSGIRKTWCPPRSLRPSIISSLASTVPSAGHQLTVCTPRYARRCVSKCACR